MGFIGNIFNNYISQGSIYLIPYHEMFPMPATNNYVQNII